MDRLLQAYHGAITIPSTEQTLQLTGGKLPRILRESQFDEKGLIVEGIGKFVPAYVGSPLGFNDPGRWFLDNVFYPRLKELGIIALCPFLACAEFLDKRSFDKSLSVRDAETLWNQFNSIVVPGVNYSLLMPRAKLLIALLDGPHVDEGVASEITHAHHLGIPIVAINSDIRMGENIAARGNPAVTSFVPEVAYFGGPGAYEKAYPYIKALADEIK